MFISNDIQFKQEQYNDLLREAEKERLIRSLFNREAKSSVVETVRHFLAEKIEAGRDAVLLMRLKNAS